MYTSLCAFIMFNKIKMPPHVCNAVHFLNVRNIKPADIHCQIYEIYDEHAMNDTMVWRWMQFSMKAVKMCTMINRMGVFW